MLLRREMVSRRHWWKTSRVEGRGQKCWLRSFLCRGTSVERRGLLNARRAAERFGEGEGRNVGFAHFCVEGRASRVEGCVRRLSTLDSRRSANFCWPSPLGPRRSTASWFYDSGHGMRKNGESRTEKGGTEAKADRGEKEKEEGQIPKFLKNGIRLAPTIPATQHFHGS